MFPSRPRSLLLLSFLAVLFGAAFLFAARGSAQVAPPQRVAAWSGDRILIKVADPALLRVDGANVAAGGELGVALRGLALRGGRELVAGVFVLQAGGDIDAPNVARRLASLPGVEYAEPDYRLQADLTPNDPHFAEQWALPAIGAPAAWDITTGSSNIIVALLDTGVSAHPELRGRLVDGYNALDDNAVTADDNGHGTFTAGIIAAQGNNGSGVAGLAWGVRIMPVKVLGSQGGGVVSDFVTGIRWAVDHGARLINISAGVDKPIPAMQTAMQYALEHGVLIITSAGNTPDGNPRYPAGYDEALAVSATGKGDVAAPFSSFGAYVDMSAPGVDIISTAWNNGDYGYTWGSGTSASAPFVTGAAALLLSVKPGLSVAQLRDLLVSTSDDLGARGPDGHFGAGRLDILRALQVLVPPTPTATRTRTPIRPTATHSPTRAAATAASTDTTIPTEAAPPPTDTPTAVPSATATAQAATLAAQQDSAAPGASLTLSGAHFAANENIGLRMTGADERNQELGSATADGAGNFTIEVTLPGDAPPGPAMIFAQGAASGLRAQAAITISNPPPAPTDTALPSPTATPTLTPTPNATIAVPSIADADPAVAFQQLPAVNAPAGAVYFKAVGHSLGGPFLDYWQHWGGLPIFGYPISEPFAQLSDRDGRVYLVQYFERNRFEYHPEYTGTPNEVLLGLLGRTLTRRRVFDPAPATIAADVSYFKQTGHTLGGAFAQYWQEHGGLALFGYPISEPLLENGYLVQYFERNRFEYHPEYTGTPNEVLLGRLGSDFARASGWIR